MAVGDKPEIEIVRWVKFNSPSIKERVIKLAAEASSKLGFATILKDRFNLDLNTAIIIANKFYTKSE